jgi:hypothetical protein
MILPTFSEKQLMSEIMNDMANVVHFSDYMDKKFRRLVIKSAKYPVRHSDFYTSPLKNRWIILLEARSKREVLDNCRITLVCLYKDGNGFLNAAMPTSTSGERHLIFYPYHFFKRYKERICSDKLGEKLIRDYFKLNFSYAFEKAGKRLLNSNMAYMEIYGSSMEGVAMGVETLEHNIFFKTFITYDMTKGEQIKKFADNEKIRKEIHQTI